ncbi:Ig-like domain-containing protein, partial [Pseudomonas sp. NPDC077186]|uniref:Ig-like domain-containing protein n=1 Tax=Pseudomonas sp. NPDC077186 TaxID=3364421 RepID=UPI0037CBA5C5
TATLTPSANLTDASNLITLDNTGVQDAAGNAGAGSTLSSNYGIDTLAPAVSSVSVPVGVQYNAGDTLTFVVSVSEAVIVNGTPRLAIDMGGSTVFADYVAGSGSATLVFQYSVQPGDNDADGIAVSGLLSNGATLRDASGNAMSLALNNVGDSSGVIVDTNAPIASAIVALDPTPTTADSVRYTVIFNEDVSGVDLGDFSLVTSGNASGALSSLVQIDGRTFQITVSNVAGSGTLALALNASGSAIADAAGNLLVTGLVGQAYSLAQSEGDPEFRANPPSSIADIPSAPLQPALPSLPPPPSTSPLLPPPLFEVPTLGSGIPTLGNIFINQNALAPSYIAQVFASSSDAGGDGSGSGFLGFGGGDGGVFGSSSLSNIFGSDALQESEPLKVFDGKQWGGGNPGSIFGAPTLGQQLHDLREGEQRQLRELAQALQEVAAGQPPA